MGLVASVDHTEDVRDDGAEPAEILGRLDDLSARCNHVLDHKQPAACDLAALGELGCPVGLGCLPDEHGLKSARERERSGEGTPPSSSPARTSVPAGISAMA